MWTDLRSAAVAAILCAMIASSGCGQEDLVLAGVPPAATPTPTPSSSGCVGSGGACTLDTDCCSGSCITPDGVNFMCQ